MQLRYDMEFLRFIWHVFDMRETASSQQVVDWIVEVAERCCDRIRATCVLLELPHCVAHFWRDRGHVELWIFDAVAGQKASS